MKEKELNEREISMVGLIIGGGGISNIMRSQAQSNLERITDQVPKGDLIDLTAMGLVVLGPVEGDLLFVHVQFPDGWTKKRTDHGMYTDILDEKGRKRGTIMYKPDFWDRDGRTYSVPRFSVGYDSPKWEDPSAGNIIIPIVKNSNGVIVWRGKPIQDTSGWRTGECPYKNDDSFRNENGEYYYNSSEHARFLALEVLLSVCPDYANKDLNASTLYWDAEPVWPISLSEPPKGELYKVYVELFSRSSGYGGMTHVDSGHNCNVRAESNEEAMKKAEKATKHFQGSYDRFVFRVMKEGKEVGSCEFESRPTRRVIDPYNGYCMEEYDG